MFRGQGLKSSIPEVQGNGQAESQWRGQEVSLRKNTNQSCPRQERKEEYVVGTKFCIFRDRVHRLYSIEEGKE